MRSCVNPKHLFLGTKSDNTKDMLKKSRNAKGIRHGSAKLSESQVREIKKRLATYNYGMLSELSREYGMHYNTIRDIRIGRLWRHIQP